MRTVRSRIPACRSPELPVTNNYPPAEPEVLRLLAPRRGLFAIGKRLSYRRKPVSSGPSWIPDRASLVRNDGNVKGTFPKMSNFWGLPAEPGAYPSELSCSFSPNSLPVRRAQTGELSAPNSIPVSPLRFPPSPLRTSLRTLRPELRTLPVSSLLLYSELRTPYSELFAPNSEFIRAATPW
jgi:hypothetical protein